MLMQCQLYTPTEGCNRRVFGPKGDLDRQMDEYTDGQTDRKTDLRITGLKVVRYQMENGQFIYLTV